MLARKRRRPKAVKIRGEGKTMSKGWMPGQKGQGGEGKGGSGPEKQPKKPDEPDTDAVADKAHRERDYSPALPSRDRIAKVLR